MFGFVQPDVSGLSENDTNRYQYYYCGLCHSLKKYGNFKRLTLTYDMTFLAMFLSSMYEPSEKLTVRKCIRHPFTDKPYFENEYIDYRRDMTIALMYFKTLDDWNDDGSFAAAIVSHALLKSYQTVKEKWKNQCDAIENELSLISSLEKEKTHDADACANSFGRIMVSLFCVKNNYFTDNIRGMAYNLGKFIYLADASVDYEKDIKRGSYNPLAYLDSKDDTRQLLEIIMGNCCDCFENLPLENDLYTMRNILYSGVWNMYNAKYKKENPDDK